MAYMTQETISALADVFASFCAFGSGARAKPELDNNKFAKLCRDSRLLDRRFTATDADLLFAKCKPKGERTIGFHCFQQEMLPQMAQRKGVPLDVVIQQLLAGHAVPSVSGTYADNVPLHDDPNAYTGVYRRGGPSTNDTATSDLYFITNRQDADVRGVASPRRDDTPLRDSQRVDNGSYYRRESSGRRGSGTGSMNRRPGSQSRMSGSMGQTPRQHSAPPAGQFSLSPEEAAQALRELESLQARGIPSLDDAIAFARAAAGAPPSARGGPSPRSGSIRASGPPQAPAHVPAMPADSSLNWRVGEASRLLEDLFNSFCAFGAGQRGAAEMDNVKWAKFCRETGIQDRRFTATDVDLTFSKVKPKGGRTINFVIFRDRALPEVANRKGTNVPAVIASIRGGPRSTGTVAAVVPLHDDVSAYTGVYKAGGPSNCDLATSDLAYITNRAPADVRGIQQ